ncbi:hypothetical protein K438DRAFT_2028346 [Mycena galopus ATCC 62051]|nr:hypothetical protein K438DRAFT_2028346 [Mycena galopus ATCC 62051]
MTQQDALASALAGLHVTPKPFFHPRRGSEHLQGSETHWFYIVIAGRVPGIYTHWEDAAPDPQISGFSNSTYKKHLGWLAATTVFDKAASPSAPQKTRMLEPRTEGCALATSPSTPPPSRKRAQHLRSSASAPSTPNGSKPLLYVYSRGRDTTIYANQQRASLAARCGLADSSFRKMEVTPSVTDAFTDAESVLEVYSISDFSDSE